MNELIKIEERVVCGTLWNAVDARDLHSFLGVGRKFNAWIDGRIEDYEFRESQDYLKVRSQTGPKQNRSEVEYVLALDMAKELAMIERTEKGRQIRKYFIEVEKAARAGQISPQSAWNQTRLEGKMVRKITTDIYATFIEYATGQGSQSAKMYYTNFSKMVNTSLLEIEGEKPKNLRDQLNVIQLHTLSVAENIIAKSLVECMAKGLPYKDIYQIAKVKIQAYSETVGRTKIGQSERQTMGLLA